MITIRSLIAGLMATLLAVISVATFLLVYFASLDSVESLTTLSVQTAADRLSGQISTTLLDRVTNPLVAVARASRVRTFTAPSDDPYVQSGASDVERYAWHGEWRTVFDDIVAGCPGCTIIVRFVDGAFAISFPQPGMPHRYHQFMRTLGGRNPDATVPESPFDVVSYRLELKTFDEQNVTNIGVYNPAPASRVDSTLWKDVLKKISDSNLELPATIPGLWANVDVTPNVELGGQTVGSAPSQIAMRANIIITNQTKKDAAATGTKYLVGLVSVYVPLDELRSRSEASLPTENSRVFAISGAGIVTEVGNADAVKKDSRADKCASSSTSPGADCLPSIASRQFDALNIATQHSSYVDACKLEAAATAAPGSATTTTTTGTTTTTTTSTGTRRSSTKFADTKGTVYFASPRCVETPFQGSDLRVVTLLPQSDVDSDLTTGRDISIAIVVVFFVVSLVFGYVFVWFLLRPFEVIAQRMRKAALLADNAPREEGSCLEEVARLQRAYETMNDELLRLKGFVPQSVLALDAQDEDDAGSNRSGIYAEGGDLMSPEGGPGVHMGGVDSNGTPIPGSATGRSMTDLAAVSSVTSGAGASIFRRAHIMAERLSVSVSAITRSHVAICVLNLRNFHGAIADMSTEDLSLATRQLVRIVTDVTADNRGVVDFFHGDHYVLTYNAARLCHSPTKSAITTSLRVADALVVDPVLGQLQRLGVQYHSGSSSVDKSKSSSSNGSASGSGGPVNKSASNSGNADGAAGKDQQQSQSQSPPAPAGPKLVLSSGVAAGEATVGSFGSSELKRFCTIGPCYSQAFEVELVLKDSPLLRRSPNQLPHSVGIPHFMFNHVHRMYGLEAVAMGMVTRQKMGICRVVGSAAELARQRGAGATDDFASMHAQLQMQNGSTPREGTAQPGSPADAGLKGPYVSSRDCLVTLIDLCITGAQGPTAFNSMRNENGPMSGQQMMGGGGQQYYNGGSATAGKTLQQLQAEQAENRVVEERLIAALRKKDPVGATLLEALLSNFQADLLASVSAPMVEQQEEDVLNEAFASEEDLQNNNAANANANGGQQQQQPQPKAGSAAAPKQGAAAGAAPEGAVAPAGAPEATPPPPVPAQQHAGSPPASPSLGNDAGLTPGDDAPAEQQPAPADEDDAK